MLMRLTALEDARSVHFGKRIRWGPISRFLTSTQVTLYRQLNVRISTLATTFQKRQLHFVCKLSCTTLLFSPVLPFSPGSHLQFPVVSASPLVLFPATRNVLTAPRTKPVAKSVASTSNAPTKRAARNWACKMTSRRYRIPKSSTIFNP